MRALAAAAILAAALAGAARATPAGGLAFVTHCGGNTQILSDPSVTAVAIQGPVGAVDRGAAGGTVTVTGGCGDGQLVLRVPMGVPVAVEASGDGDITLGDLAGPATVVLHGTGLHAGRLSGPFTLEADGDGDSDVAALAGSASIVINGSGDLTIGRASLGDLALTSRGNADVSVGGGQVLRLAAAIYGSGDLKIDATVGGGSVLAAGSGDVSLARVTGDLQQTQRGSGDITVGAYGAGTQAPDAHAASSAHERSDLTMALSVIVGLIKLGLFVAIAILLTRFFRRRLGHRRLAAARRDPDPAIASLAATLASLGRRTGRIEQFVTSREFELHRGFRDIGD